MCLDYHLKCIIDCTILMRLCKYTQKRIIVQVFNNIYIKKTQMTFCGGLSSFQPTVDKQMP